MKKTQVYESHKRFRDSLATVDDDLRCRQPSTSSYDETIERVPSVVQRIHQQKQEYQLEAFTASANSQFLNTETRERLLLKIKPLWLIKIQIFLKT
jgi:hypothetical protein